MMKQFWQRWLRRSPKQRQAPVPVSAYMPRQPFLLWRDFLAPQGATKARQSAAFSPLFKHPLLKGTAEDIKPWLTDFCPLVDNQSAAYPLARLLGKQQAQLASALTQLITLDRSALPYYSLPQARLTSTLHSRRLPNTDRQIADELAGLHQQMYCLIRQWERVNEAEDAIDNAPLQHRLLTLTTRLDGVIETIRAELPTDNTAVRALFESRLQSVAQHRAGLSGESVDCLAIYRIIETLQTLPLSEHWQSLFVSDQSGVQQWCQQRYTDWQWAAWYQHYPSDALRTLTGDYLPIMTQWIIDSQRTLLDHHAAIPLRFYQRYYTSLDTLTYGLVQTKRAVCHAIGLHRQLRACAARGHPMDAYRALLTDCQSLAIPVKQLPPLDTAVTDRPDKPIHPALTAYLDAQGAVLCPPIDPAFRIIALPAGLIPTSLSPYIKRDSWFKRAWLACFPSARHAIHALMNSSPYQTVVARWLQQTQPLLAPASLTDDDPCRTIYRMVWQDWQALERQMMAAYQHSVYHSQRLRWWQWLQKDFHRAWQRTLRYYQRQLMQQKTALLKTAEHGASEHPLSSTYQAALAYDIATAIHADNRTRLALQDAQTLLKQRIPSTVSGYTRLRIHGLRINVPDGLATVLQGNTLSSDEKKALKKHLLHLHFFFHQLARLPQRPLGLDDWQGFIHHPATTQLQPLYDDVVAASAMIVPKPCQSAWQAMLDKATTILRDKQIQLLHRLGTVFNDSMDASAVLADYLSPADHQWLTDWMAPLDAAIAQSPDNPVALNTWTEAKMLLGKTTISDFKRSEAAIQSIIEQLTQGESPPRKARLTLVYHYHYLMRKIDNAIHPANAQATLLAFKQRCQPALQQADYSALQRYIAYAYQKAHQGQPMQAPSSQLQESCHALSDLGLSLKTQASSVLRVQLLRYLTWQIVFPSRFKHQAARQFIDNIRILSERLCPAQWDHDWQTVPQDSTNQSNVSLCLRAFLALGKHCVGQCDRTTLLMVQDAITVLIQHVGCYSERQLERLKTLRDRLVEEKTDDLRAVQRKDANQLLIPRDNGLRGCGSSIGALILLSAQLMRTQSADNNRGDDPASSSTDTTNISTAYAQHGLLGAAENQPLSSSPDPSPARRLCDG